MNFVDWGWVWLAVGFATACWLSARTSRVTYDKGWALGVVLVTVFGPTTAILALWYWLEKIQKRRGGLRANHKSKN